MSNISDGIGSTMLLVRLLRLVLHQQPLILRLGQGWVFFAWMPDRPRTDSGYAGAHHAFNGLGPAIVGTYNPGTTQPGIHYERLDPCKDHVSTLVSLPC
jgi:hypothetical protein